MSYDEPSAHLSEPELAPHPGSTPEEARQELALLYQGYPGTVLRLSRDRTILGYKLAQNVQTLPESGPWLGKRLSAVFAEDMASALDHSIDGAIVAGEVKVTEYGIRHADEDIVLNVRTQPTPDGGTILYISDVTAKETERHSLRESSRRLRDVFNHTRVFLALTLPDGTLLEINQTALDFCGARRSDVINQPFWEGPWWTHSVELQERLRRSIQSAANGESNHFEVTHVGADGLTHVIDFSLQPVKDESGRVIFLVPEGRDISLRKDAEDALYQSEQMLRIVLDAIPERVYWKDNKLRYLGCNTVAAVNAGLAESSAIVGKTDFDLTWRDMAEVLRADDRAVILSGKPKPACEETLTQPDGTVRWVRTSKIPLSNREGHVVGLVNTYEDITEQKRVEEVLRESEERHRAYIANAPYGIFVADEKGRYVQVNASACRITGYEEHELLSMHIPDLVFEDGREEAVRHFEIAAREGVSHGELTLRPKSGERRWWSVEAVKLSDTRFLGFCHDITERRRAQEALRESREFLNTILNSIPVRVFWKDRNLVYLGCNSTFARDAGFERPEDIVGKDDYAMSWREQAEFYRADDRGVIESGQAKLLFEEPQITPSGEVIYLLTSKLPLRAADGTIVGVLGTYYDISDRRKADVALRESESRMRAITDFAQDAIIMMDGAGGISFWNPSAERIFGYSAGEAIGKNLHQLLAPQRHLEAHRSAFPPFLESGQGSAVGKISELEAIRKDGQEIAVQLSLSSAKIGDIWSAIGVVRDVTEHRQLQRRQTLLSAAVESAAEVVVITDTEGDIKYANSAFERVTGYLREDVLGQNASVNKSGLHDSRFYGDLWAKLMHGQVWKGRFKNRRKDGSLYDEDATISPVFDERGHITNFVAVKRDVTKELSLEEQLRQSQKLEAIGTLAGGIAHDFNNMLTAIVGHASFLKTQNMDHERVVESATEIIRTCDRAVSLTRQLLAYGRHQPVQPVACDLNDRLSDLAGMLRRLIGDDIELLLDLDANARSIHIDSSQLDQIVLNLVVNARDAMPSGGTVILQTANRTIRPTEITEYPNLPSGEYTMLLCSDTGDGMTPDVAARIFDPFFTTKEQGKGTGLGLSTVYGIVKQAKGFIGVESEQFKGACFTVLFPALREGSAPVDAPIHVERQTVSGSGMILLAEGDGTARAARRVLLESNGYEVLEALSAEEAASIVRNWPGRICMLLADVEMSDGQETTLVRDARDAQPDIAILLMSSHAGTAAMKVGVPGADVQLLSKQCTPGELLETIGTTLGSVKLVGESR
jgi:two-component system cell cycle sensor histidine kinase/response regulator CckA